MKMKTKLVLIGIDAMDPVIVDELIDDLPNFQSLMTYSRLGTTIPPETPVAWSAASSGTNPGKYGIFDFISRDPHTYLPRLSLAIESPGLIKTKYASAMRGEPFWRILSRHNISSSVIRWPVTFPAEQIRGRLLSGLGVVDIKGLLNSYAFYTTEELKGDEEGKEKIVPLEIRDNEALTYISGPVIRKSSGLMDVRIPLKIRLTEEGAILEIEGKAYPVKLNSWSEIIRVKFKLGLLFEAYGIFRVYLLSHKPIFRMYMTSIQIDPENQFFSITYPKEYGKRLVEKMGLFYTLGMPEDTKAVTENRLPESVFLEQIKQIEEQREKMFSYEFGQFKEGALAFVFDAGDRLQHIFWRNGMKKDFSNGVPEEIKEYYINKDKFLGGVMAGIDKDTPLLIISDHGFTDFKRAVNINSWLVEEGYMKLKDETSQKSLFEFVDWDNTYAYSLGFTSLYLNLKGRDGRGIVEKDDAENLKKEIMRKLRGIKDDGKAVLTNVYDSKDIYKGEYSSIAPDIVLGFHEGYRMSWKNAVGGLDPEIIFENTGKWRGDHLVDRTHVPGVFFANFSIRKKMPTLLDIAPTVLSFFDIEPTENMEGEVLR